MKVIIENTHISEKAGTSAKTGKDYLIREQRARLHGEHVRFDFKLLLERDQPAYPAGEYELDLEHSLYPGSFESLRFSPKLVAKGQPARLGAAA